MNWQWASNAPRPPRRWNLPEPTALRGDVDQRQGLWTQVLVH